MHSVPRQSRKSIEAMYDRGVAEQKEMANPDSPYWHGLFDLAREDLTALLGKDGYEQWAEILWPGDTIDGKTWQQIYRQTDAALEAAQQGERDLFKLADAAEGR